MADRYVIFRIGIGAHPATGRRLVELADGIKRTVLQVESLIFSVGTIASETSRTIDDSFGIT